MGALVDVVRFGVMGLVIGAIVALVGQGSPPLHVLSHELAQISSIALGVAQTGIARLCRRQRPRDLDAAFVVALAAGMGLGVGVHGVASFANAYLHGCDPANTGLFFWMTWAPLGLLMTVVGLATASWRAGQVLLLVAAMVAGTLLHDVSRSAAGLYFADPLIGFPVFLDQRLSMEISGRAVLQRGWLLWAAATLFLVLRARNSGVDLPRPGLDAPSGLAVVLLSLVTVGWAGQLGMGPGVGPRRVLDGVHQGEHVRLRYDRSGEARHYLEMIEGEAEWAIHRLTEAWGVSRDGLMVSLDIYDDEEALFSSTGRTSAHGDHLFAAMVWTDGLDDTMHHEMVHVLDHLAGHPPWILSLNRGRDEGSAEAWTDGYAERPEVHEVLTVAARRGRLPSAADLLAPGGFWAVEEQMAYRASGSFVGFLILEYGVDRWRRWLATQDLEGTYGQSVEALDAEWRTFLLALEPSARAERTATWAFDPVLNPPAAGARCPKLGYLEPDTFSLAREAQWASDHETALELFRGLYAERPTAYLFWRVVDQLEWMGRHEAVLAELDQVDAERVGASRVAEARVRNLAALGRGGAELAQVIDERLARRPHGRLAAARRLLEVPELADAVLPLLVRRSEEHEIVQQARVARLVHEHPEHADDLQALVSDLDGFPKLTARESRPDAEDLVVLTLARLASAPDACSPPPNRWGYIPENFLQMGTCDLAVTLLDALDGRCDDPRTHWRIDRLRSRLEWQVAREPRGTCATTLAGVTP